MLKGDKKSTKFILMQITLNDNIYKIWENKLN